MKTTDWFIKRGLKVLNYQENVLGDIKQSMSKQDVTILAACPSAGKTIMSIFSIENYLLEHPNAKILTLCHGTTVLRTQFCEVLDEVKPNFTSNLVEKFSDYNSNSQVNVCLPQTLTGHTLSHIDLLVVDEAHQFYFADMVQNIIKQIKPTKQLLLTGTPSIFIQKKYPIIPIPMMTIYGENMISDIKIEIAVSSYYSYDVVKDFNEDKELKSEIDIKDNETKKTLDELLSKIVAKLSNNKNIRTWSQTLTQLQKTMFACRNQKQAQQIKQYFDAIGINSALSISDTDSTSSEIQRFKTEDNCLILIVVGRGILGFNYSKLTNLIDLTMSQNIDRIYQLFSRVVRKHPDGLQKLFFKIVPKDKSDYYKYIMSGVLALTSEEFFTKYNGKNFDDLKIPVIKVKAEKKNLNNYKTKNIKKYEPINFSDLPVFEFFKNIYSGDKTLNTYTLTNISDVRAEFLNRKPLGFWTLDKCLESAKQFGSSITWKVGDFEAYQASKYYNWYNECIKHMTPLYHLQIVCMEVAQKYTNIKDWQKKDKCSYDIAVKYDWLQECTEHMLINA
jgi:superfamily II DNA or RNA helicase